MPGKWKKQSISTETATITVRRRREARRKRRPVVWSRGILNIRLEVIDEQFL